jgi:LysM repeat protein
MWNSSRRIALTATAVALVGGGLVGLAWMANWLPIEFGDTPTGEVVSEVNIDELSWPGQSDLDAGSVGTPWDDQMPPDDIFGGQSEPGDAATTGGRREFVSRAGWTTEANGAPGAAPRFPGGSTEFASGASIPEEFPSVSRHRRGAAPSSAVGRDGRLNLDTQPHQVIQRASYETEGSESPFGASNTAREPARSPLFTASEPGTLSQAQQFPDGVAVLDRAPVFDDPNGASAEGEPATTETPAAAAPAQPAANVTQPEATPAEPPTGTAPATGPARPAIGTELDLREIDGWIKEGNYVPAHRDLSKIYWNNPESRRYIQERLDKNARLIYFSSQPHFLEPYVIRSGDYLQRVAPKYRITWQYLANVNGINPRRIREGQKLKVIKGPFSIFVDLRDFELTVHCHGFYVKRYGIGIGKDGASPVGRFTVLNKVEKPQWTNPITNRVVSGDDPTNPLGTHWIDIGDGFGIHGTIKPTSIGKAESRGCVRMLNSDVKEVYDFLVDGSEVVIRP